MTANTPMTGRDSAAAFKGLIIGAICIATVVLSIVFLTNRKFEAHEQPTAESTH